MTAFKKITFQGPADIALINIFNSEAAGVGDLHPVEMLQDQVRKLFLNADSVKSKISF